MSKIVERCLAGKHRNKYTITGKTIQDYCYSPFTLWCNYFAPSEEREPVNPYLHLLGHRGRVQKERVLNSLRAKKIEFRTFKSGFTQTIKECEKGVEKIANVPLFFLPKNMFGMCDAILKDTTADSDFGQYQYKPLMIKNAKRMKRDYLVQCAFYAYVLGQIQGSTPQHYCIMDKQGKVHEYEYQDIEERLMEVLADIKEIQKGKKISPTAKCCKWPWTAYCTKKAIETDDVSIIPMIGPVLKEKLNRKGINTVKELVDSGLVMDEPKWDKIIKHARAYVEHKPQILQKPKMPESEAELFIDLEGTDEIELEDGIVKVDYLLGVLAKDKDKTEYIPFISRDLKGEEEMYKDFFRFLKKYDGAPIYHYGPHEKIHLRHMAQKCKYKEKLNTVDLLSKIRKCTAFPTISQSLKDIAGYLGYRWRGTVDAQETIVLYLKYLDTKDEELLKRIMKYNEDDCRATLKVKEFLASQ